MTADSGTAPTTHRLALRLLDHQIVGPNGQLLGNADDAQLAITAGRWLVTGLLVGPGALGARLPGKVGTWTVAIWQRLHQGGPAKPCLVPLAEVTEIGSALRVNHSATAALSGSFGLEHWLRHHVVSRIPGATGGEDDGPDPGACARAVDPGTERAGLPTPPVEVHAAETVTASDILGITMRDPDGRPLGRVLDLLCAEPAADQPRDHLLVTHLVYGPRRAGATLGYDQDRRQGPSLVGAVIRWWQRPNRVARVADVAGVNLSAGGGLTINSAGNSLHPLDL